MSFWGAIIAGALAFAAWALGYVHGRSAQATEDQALVKICNEAIDEQIKGYWRQVHSLEARTAKLELGYEPLYDQLRPVPRKWR